MSPEAPGSIFPYLNAPGRGQSTSGGMPPVFGNNTQLVSGAGSALQPGSVPGMQQNNPSDFLQKMVMTTALIDAMGGKGKTAELASKAGGLLGGMFGGKGGGAGGAAAGSGGSMDAIPAMASIA